LEGEKRSCGNIGSKGIRKKKLGGRRRRSGQGLANEVTLLGVKKTISWGKFWGGESMKRA